MNLYPSECETEGNKKLMSDNIIVSTVTGSWDSPLYHMYYKIALNDLSRACHAANEKWWRNPQTNEPIERNRGELMMLMVSEIAEAMEGERKNLPDDKLPHRPMAEVELVDCLIRIFDYAGGFGYDLGGAFVEKMAYNAKREDHTHAARLKEHGKRF